MNKALDILRRLASGNNRGDFFISNELLKEIEAALAQPEYEADRRSDPISKLRNLRDIQGRKGNYDIDEYMRGLYNGLELSLSIFEDRRPDYKEHIAQPEVANANLISAAPELLEALKNWINALDVPSEWMKCRDDAKKAIAKAHGITGVDDE